MPKKVLTYGIIILIIFWVASRPNSAASLVNSIVTGLTNLGNGVIDMVTKVSGVG